MLFNKTASYWSHGFYLCFFFPVFILFYFFKRLMVFEEGAHGRAKALTSV